MHPPLTKKRILFQHVAKKIISSFKSNYKSSYKSAFHSENKLLRILSEKK